MPDTTLGRSLLRHPRPARTQARGGWPRCPLDLGAKPVYQDHRKKTVGRSWKAVKTMHADLFTSIATTATISACVYLLVATVLAWTDRPTTPAKAPKGIDFLASINADYSHLPDQRSLTSRSGAPLAYRLYGEVVAPKRMIVLVHGSGWHGMQFHSLASELSQDGETVVVVPDLRGHGANPERRGDVDHIGQLEDDLADLIEVASAGLTDVPVILAGHSSGGGLVVRFAGGKHGQMADGFILIAPFLKYNAPTTRAKSGGWAFPAVRRIIGLSMLNTVGITALNRLPVIAFAMPQAVLDGPYGGTATTTYSYRLNTSFAPRSNYQADLRAMTRPLLLLAGADDEAFNVSLYEPVISAQTSTGTYEVLPNAGHISILTDARASAAIKGWLTATGL